MKVKLWWIWVKKAGSRFSQKSAFFHAAALSYYALFSLVPMLYLSLISFGSLVGKERCIQMITELFQQNMGISDVNAFTDYIRTLIAQESSLFFNAIMFFVLIYAASAFMVSLKFSLNEFFGVERNKRQKTNLLLSFLSFRITSIAHLALMGFLIFLFYFLQVLIFTVIEQYLVSHPIWELGIFNLVHHSFSMLLNMVLIYLMFRVVQSGTLSKPAALKGAMITGVLLYFSQVAVKYYLNHFFFLGKGEAIGNLFILMAWVFYTAQIIFFGASLTHVIEVEGQRNNVVND
jgi:membrane protein